MRLWNCGKATGTNERQLRCGIKLAANGAQQTMRKAGFVHKMIAEAMRSQCYLVLEDEWID